MHDHNLLLLENYNQSMTDILIDNSPPKYQDSLTSQLLDSPNRES